MARIARRTGRSAALVCVLVLASTVPSIVARAEPGGDSIAAADIATSTQDSLRGLLSSNTEGTKDQLFAFYEARDFKPVWSGSGSASERAETVRAALDHADEQGLRREDYVHAISQWNDAPKEGHDAAEYDLAMTAALFRYAKDVRTGRLDPNDVYKDVDLPMQNFDLVAEFGEALKHDRIDSFLADLPPPDPAYRKLAEALVRYRAIEAKGGWPIVPGRTTIALDGTDARAAILMKRLAFEDEALAANPQPSLAELRVAVLRYQRRNGLEDDGKVGAEMLRQLNIPASFRAKQIAANMERWRWMPRQFERRYILVNAADQSLDFIRDGSVLLHSRVIVGRKDNATPILRTMVTGVVANPPWDIPDDIVAQSILPKLRRSPDYLATRNMVLADGPADDRQGININWQDVHAGNIPYQFQQNPGADNALGALMLDMPNRFNVYLHDTPNKDLFLADTREKSHGCVRVQEIFPLASLALTDSTDDGSYELTQAVASGETQHLKLSEPLPVYMLYWTAIVDANGEIGFRPDRYGRDHQLLERLEKRPEARFDNALLSAASSNPLAPESPMSPSLGNKYLH